MQRIHSPREWVTVPGHAFSSEMHAVTEIRLNGGHRPPNSVSESIDFESRILAWYDKYLKATSPSPTSQQ